MPGVARVWLAGVLALAVCAPAVSHRNRSRPPLAKELSAALDAAKLDSIAAKDPTKPDVFFGALYFPGIQLLVVSAQYTAPLHMNETIGKKEYRDVYLDLSSASVPRRKSSSKISAPTGSGPSRKTISLRYLRGRRASARPSTATGRSSSCPRTTT